jgi:hypothetical protein
MKSLQVKYEEAVARNLASFLTTAPKKVGDQLKQLASFTLESVKARIGIRSSDTRHDTSLATVLQDAQRRTEKAVKKPAPSKPESAETHISPLSGKPPGMTGYLGMNLKKAQRQTS